jgi:DNA-binding LacI/PurR family transcriptional regulator
MNIYDIANIAGVSIATVSRVINNEGSVKPENKFKVTAIIRLFEFEPDPFAKYLGKKHKSRKISIG